MPELQPTSPPVTPRPRPRMPSGPRPRPMKRDSEASFRSISSSALSIPAAGSTSVQHQASSTSLTSVAKLRELNDSPLDALIDTEHEYTISPEASPELQGPTSPPLHIATSASPKKWTSPIKSPERGRTFALISGKREESVTRSRTLPVQAIPKDGFSLSRPSTPTFTKVASPPAKVKPKPSKLNTLNLLIPSSTSPTKPVSPGLRHWQQVRQHVMAPTPLEEKPGTKMGKKMGLVSKAAGKFGFRHAADHMMGHEDRRASAVPFGQEIGGLSAEEREEIARERRKFARDVKACLDACSMEETKRRLQRADPAFDGLRLGAPPGLKQIAGSVHGSQYNPNGRYNFDPNFSSFAPLLMELHRHLPAARAKRLWSRTCPHHASILAELGVSFLSDDSSTDGERQQGLEVFGVIVRNWASDSAEEELDRWLWLCRAMMIPDKQLRNRGLPLLASFLHGDPDLPMAHDRPHTAAAFQSLSMALLELLYALELSGAAFEEHRQAVLTIIGQLMNGDVIEVDPSSLKDILQSAMDTHDHGRRGGGLEPELFWLALAHVTRSQRALAHWLLRDAGEVLSRFSLPPLLHATPPVILHLRVHSILVWLTSLSGLLDSVSEEHTGPLVWQVVERLFIMDIEHLPDADGGIAMAMAGLFFSLDNASIARSLLMGQTGDVDPFRISTEPANAATYHSHRSKMAELLKQEAKRSAFIGALKQYVSVLELPDLTRLVRLYLTESAFSSLAATAVSAFFLRLLSIGDQADKSDVPDLLGYLQVHRPQLLYKPVFSLSASTSPTTLLGNLKIVRSLSIGLGPARFWTMADPQMVVIVLMGDTAPKENKGKGREREKPIVTVKLGRYACLVELILALDQIPPATAKEKSVRTFLDSLENRIGAMAEAEQQQGSLPVAWRSLLCEMLIRIRRITSSVRRAPWQRLVVPWLLDLENNRATDDHLALLSATYGTVASSGVYAQTSRRADRKGSESTQSRPIVKDIDKVDELLKIPLASSALSLLVALQSCLTKDDWLALLPYLWANCSQKGSLPKQIVFLLMKCGEVIPTDWENLIMSDLYSIHSSERLTALRKLSSLNGWRFQVLSQFILTDRRGPVFQFPARTLEYVATEIGSPHWVAPHDVQDAALRKFGTTLPLELRQRLMELGWSDDETIAGVSDWEQIPISALPSLQFNISSEGGISAPSSPMKALNRHGSNASGSAFHGKRRRAVFAPVLLSVISQQASLLAHDPDSLVGAASRDLLRLLERDDHAMFLRPFTDSLGLDFHKALSSLNAVLAVITPAFAYSALNSITGYLKTILRTDASFSLYAPALATVSVLVPHVSEVSLRDIRKHKAEQVLLPAAIHEEEGGYKLHPPWREGMIEVQTAQLLLLTEILKVNPREVYLFKKMLSNLPIQASIANRGFARAWLVLITTLLSTINRNYNDRAELRHFLSNIANILLQHGTSDVLIVAHSLRAFMLCSARFRRLFASIGFTTCLPAVLRLYADSVNHTAIRDAMEFSARSFYRIHGDNFVYQACVVIAESRSSPKAAYDFLACLSTSNAISSGRAAGLRGLNDNEEIEALVQMLLGPELTLAEIGTDAAERAASKMASIDLNGNLFPKANIIKLLVTVIAANPATMRAVNFLRLFAGMIPYFQGAQSVDLLREGVEALGSVILKGKVAEDAAKSMFNPGEENSRPDWNASRREYILLVQAFARNGGHVSSTATKRTLEMVHDLLRKQPEVVGHAASSILKEFAKTHLHASGSRPMTFLRDIAPVFRLFINVVDFSGLLEEVTDLIVRADYDLDADTTEVIIDSYVGPAIRTLARASEDDLAFIVPLRTATVDLLAAAVFLPGDALESLESRIPNANLLASLVLPLCLSLEAPREVDKEALYYALWVRLLRYVTRSTISTGDRNKPLTPQGRAVAVVISMQIVKLITLRAHDGISKTTGLWSYIAKYLCDMIRAGDGEFLESDAMSPRILDWMMWSTFELLVLHNSPLIIEMQYLIQTSLAGVIRDANKSTPSTPGEGGRFSLSPNVGRARMPSARSPSIFSRQPSGSVSPTVVQGRLPSAAHLTPDSGNVGKGGHRRMPSQHLSPVLGHGRAASVSGGGAGYARPSFADLSARRASRPAFMLSGGSSLPYRFPSSQPVRQLAGEKGGGAIIHLLGAPNQVLGATSAAIPTLAPRSVEDPTQVLRDLRLNSPALQEGARRAVRSCKVVFGLGDDVEEEVQVWSTEDAIREVAEQTRLFIEEEFRDVFVPSASAKDPWHDAPLGTSESVDDEKEGYSVNQIRSYDLGEKLDEDEELDDEVERMLPKFTVDAA